MTEANAFFDLIHKTTGFSPTKLKFTDTETVSNDPTSSDKISGEKDVKDDDPGSSSSMQGTLPINPNPISNPMSLPLQQENEQKRNETENDSPKSCNYGDDKPAKDTSTKAGEKRSIEEANLLDRASQQFLSVKAATAHQLQRLSEEMTHRKKGC